MRALWLALHRWLGLIAGIVLAVVGFTGAMLSFEREIVLALNPEVALLVAEKERTLPPEGARRETRKLLREAPSGRAFFRGLREVHRHLAAGDFGKSIVGVCTVFLIALCLSGLYLRWPPHPLRWRAWFKLDFRLRGRAFLWQLHAVSGAAVLLFYLLAGLTGLYWSYEWYRDGLLAIAGPDFKSALLPLHSGSLFGIAGRIIMTIASALMPLFLLTGWMMYLQRPHIRQP